MDTPIVILNYKTYLESSGANALDLAHDLESAASESGIKMVAVPQAADIYRINQETSLPIFAQHIDPIAPGGHTGSNLIDTLIEAGISGSLINHSEIYPPVVILASFPSFIKLLTTLKSG